MWPLHMTLDFRRHIISWIVSGCRQPEPNKYDTSAENVGFEAEQKFSSANFRDIGEKVHTL